jgi:hypothetical protein
VANMYWVVGSMISARCRCVASWCLQGSRVSGRPEKGAGLAALYLEWLGRVLWASARTVTSDSTGAAELSWLVTSSNFLVADLAGLFHGRKSLGDVRFHPLLRVILMEGQAQLLLRRLHRVHFGPSCADHFSPAFPPVKRA